MEQNYMLFTQTDDDDNDTAKCLNVATCKSTVLQHCIGY